MKYKTLADFDFAMFRKNPSFAHARVLYLEYETLPEDILKVFGEGIQKQADDYQFTYFSDNEKRDSDLYIAIEERESGVTQEDIFRCYASEWRIKAAGRSEPWELLKNRYKRFKQKKIIRK